MKYLFILLAAIGFIPLVNAQGFNLGSALQAAQQMTAGQQAGATGTGMAGTGALGQQAQTAMMQQAMQMMAQNPQLLTQVAGSLSPQQQASLLQQTMGVANKNFTPQEQASLNAFAATPEGQSIMAKLPGVIQQLAPMVLQMYAGQMGTMAPAAGK
ncbi:MAG: hypothetical protein DI628_04520 [Blastochloris viridis]|uniref:DUF2059 domain-containing protein n=1 Tax=Blastochloris viridis TaxID=1079 RepID=A0A6N4RF33_BLAVI|nr:MAG: hypothetical protein DI628_04520 [Blastochloris viridis]